MESTKRIIWTNVLDYEDYRADYEEWMPDEEGYTEEDRIRMMNEGADEDLDEERSNLNKPIYRSLVMIATLDLWNGTRKGWKHIEGNNLNDIFQGTCGDYVTWYVDENGDICCDDTHHDGTNHYVYRAIKPQYTDWEFDEAMYDGEDADELTEKLGHYVKEIYGF